MDPFAAALDLLRQALLRMADPPVTGHVALYLNERGEVTSVNPRHPFDRRQLNWQPHAELPCPPAVLAALEEMAAALPVLAAAHLNCRLMIQVLVGVPQLPLEIEPHLIPPAPVRAA